MMSGKNNNTLVNHLDLDDLDGLNHPTWKEEHIDLD